MFDRNIFAERVKEMRLSKNLKQIELGNILSLSVQAINDIEKGRKITTFDSLVILAEYFNVSTDWLLGVSDMRERR
ncbi:MAG: helix-turn-helix domain-containing protein [Oscillospiraceae bacterium]|nr:helix-turn-helix domain-containing protein [Oscillospiraceae bacterium]